MFRLKPRGGICIPSILLAWHWRMPGFLESTSKQAAWFSLDKRDQCQWAVPPDFLVWIWEGAGRASPLLSEAGGG